MQSENINEITAAMAKAQSQAESAIKSHENPFYGSSYANLSDVIKACQDALNKNGCWFKFISEVDGDRYYLITHISHSSGQWMSSKIPLILKKNDMQQYGAAMTYAERYGLQAMVGINIEEDDDGNSLVTPCEEYNQFMKRFNDQSKEAKIQLKKDLSHISAAKKSPADRNFWRDALNEIIRATN